MAGASEIFQEKGEASLTLGEVVSQTAKNYPDSRFHPRILAKTPYYTISSIDPSPYGFGQTADGIGTKPELAERLYMESLVAEKPVPEVFESLAFDLLAMIDGDEARFGKYMVSVLEVVDLNSAKDKSVVAALARGLKRACDEGEFSLTTGETAELGYRQSGFGDTRLNWNAAGASIVNPDKLLSMYDIKPGQVIVALREKSIRSNGLSKARAILEVAYLLSKGFPSKEDYVWSKFASHGVFFDKTTMGLALDEVFGHDAMEQIQLPWHTTRPDIVRQLLMPSKLYGPIIRDALGRIDEPKNVGLVAAAHITGGGVPEKTNRLVKPNGLGADVEAVFPDPEGVTSLLDLANSFPEEIRDGLKIDDKTACEQWNRGIGFLGVVETKKEAKKLIEIAERKGCEGEVAGEITDKPEINFRGHTWPYEREAV